MVIEDRLALEDRWQACCPTSRCSCRADGGGALRAAQVARASRKKRRARVMLSRRAQLNGVSVISSTIDPLFRRLYESGHFLIPDSWDIGSAGALARRRRLVARFRRAEAT